ncbi:hep_Hag family protein [Babesia caballi]|uniref:Hep_Hag family protein n=1 Tax=Babesia caballi TaxID=5871 RepID=A0AAV4M151_BABCB|nr:hep_Hag family protein [Babesia caballi]
MYGLESLIASKVGPYAAVTIRSVIYIVVIRALSVIVSTSCARNESLSERNGGRNSFALTPFGKSEEWDQWSAYVANGRQFSKRSRFFSEKHADQSTNKNENYMERVASDKPLFEQSRSRPQPGNVWKTVLEDGESGQKSVWYQDENDSHSKLAVHGPKCSLEESSTQAFHTAHRYPTFIGMKTDTRKAPHGRRQLRPPPTTDANQDKKQGQSANIPFTQNYSGQPIAAHGRVDNGASPADKAFLNIRKHIDGMADRIVSEDNAARSSLRILAQMYSHAQSVLQSSSNTHEKRFMQNVTRQLEAQFNSLEQGIKLQRANAMQKFQEAHKEAETIRLNLEKQFQQKVEPTKGPVLTPIESLTIRSQDGDFKVVGLDRLKLAKVATDGSMPQAERDFAKVRQYIDTMAERIISEDNYAKSRLRNIAQMFSRARSVMQSCKDDKERAFMNSEMQRLETTFNSLRAEILQQRANAMQEFQEAHKEAETIRLNLEKQFQQKVEPTKGPVLTPIESLTIRSQDGDFTPAASALSSTLSIQHEALQKVPPGTSAPQPPSTNGRGPPSPPGTQGTSGPRGTSGSVGTSAPQPPSTNGRGPPSPPGTQGTSGPRGTSGSVGTSAPQPPSTNGRGPPSPPGTQGTSGPRGTSGSVGTSAPQLPPTTDANQDKKQGQSANIPFTQNYSGQPIAAHGRVDNGASPADKAFLNIRKHIDGMADRIVSEDNAARSSLRILAQMYSHAQSVLQSSSNTHEKRFMQNVTRQLEAQFNSLEQGIKLQRANAMQKFQEAHKEAETIRLNLEKQFQQKVEPTKGPVLTPIESLTIRSQDGDFKVVGLDRLKLAKVATDGSMPQAERDFAKVRQYIDTMAERIISEDNYAKSRLRNIAQMFSRARSVMQSCKDDKERAFMNSEMQRLETTFNSLRAEILQQRANAMQEFQEAHKEAETIRLNLEKQFQQKVEPTKGPVLTPIESLTIRSQDGDFTPAASALSSTLSIQHEALQKVPPGTSAPQPPSTNGRGPPSPPGTQGTSGPRGTSGSVGTSAPQPPSTNGRGPPSPPGTQGTSGPRGTSGSVGTSAPQPPSTNGRGPPSPPGTQGTSGPRGTSGSVGTSAPQPPSTNGRGPPSPPGTQGTSGPRGTSGSVGTSAPQPPSTNGRGPPSPPGTQGTSGPRGTSGSVGTSAPQLPPTTDANQDKKQGQSANIPFTQNYSGQPIAAHGRVDNGASPADKAFLNIRKHIDGMADRIVSEDNAARSSLRILAQMYSHAQSVLQSSSNTHEKRFMQNVTRQLEAQFNSLRAEILQQRANAMQEFQEAHKEAETIRLNLEKQFQQKVEPTKGPVLTPIESLTIRSQDGDFTPAASALSSTLSIQHEALQKVPPGTSAPQPPSTNGRGPPSPPGTQGTSGPRGTSGSVGTSAPQPPSTNGRRPPSPPGTQGTSGPRGTSGSVGTSAPQPPSTNGRGPPSPPGTQGTSGPRGTSGSVGTSAPQPPSTNGRRPPSPPGTQGTSGPRGTSGSVGTSAPQPPSTNGRGPPSPPGTQGTSGPRGTSGSVGTSAPQPPSTNGRGPPSPPGTQGTSGPRGTSGSVGTSAPQLPPTTDANQDKKQGQSANIPFTQNYSGQPIAAHGRVDNGASPADKAFLNIRKHIDGMADRIVSEDNAARSSLRILAQMYSHAQSVLQSSSNTHEKRFMQNVTRQLEAQFNSLRAEILQQRANAMQEFQEAHKEAETIRLNLEKQFQQKVEPTKGPVLTPIESLTIRSQDGDFTPAASALSSTLSIQHEALQRCHLELVLHSLRRLMGVDRLHLQEPRELVDLGELVDQLELVLHSLRRLMGVGRLHLQEPRELVDLGELVDQLELVLHSLRRLMGVGRLHLQEPRELVDLGELVDQLELVLHSLRRLMGVGRLHLQEPRELVDLGELVDQLELVLHSLHRLMGVGRLHLKHQQWN